MKIFLNSWLLMTSVAVLALPLGVNAEQSAATEHKFEKARQYYTECRNADAAEFDKIRPQLKAFTDAEVMAETLADPVRFARLIAVVNDPRTMHVMMKCATEPVMWDTWMRGLTNPAKLMAAMSRFANPAVYMNWAMAPMNPALYAPAMTFMQPAYYTAWMNAMMNPAFYQPFYAFMDPAWYTPRIQWLTNPASYQPMLGLTSVTAPVPAKQKVQPE